jgi:hypothetical protein
MDIAGAGPAVGDPGDADDPEHGGQPALVAWFAPGAHPALRPHDDWAGTCADLLLLSRRAQVQVVLQQQPEQVRPAFSRCSSSSAWVQVLASPPDRVRISVSKALRE